MAYKYKLVKELERDTIGDIGKFIRSVTIEPGGIPLEAMRKIFVEIPGSSNPNDEISILDKGIRDILIDDGKFSEDEVEEYMEYLYDLRKNTVTPSGIPINEKEKEEKSFMDIASEKAKKGENPDPEDLEQYQRNKAKGNTYMTPKQRREREEQGKKNLTQEVLRRLRNR